MNNNNGFNAADYLPSADDIGSFLSDVSHQVDGLNHDMGAAQSTVRMIPAQPEPQHRAMDFGKAAVPAAQDQNKQSELIRDVTQGEWTFRINGANQTIKIIAGSGSGTTYRPGSEQYATVMRNLLASGGAIAATVQMLIPGASDIAAQVPAPVSQTGVMTAAQYAPPAIPIYQRRETWVAAGTVAALAGMYYFGVFDRIARVFDRD